MIKFFRHIRHQLLSENKPASPAGRFSKYLLYAIGEIVLVVVGILMALQINNWNEQRKDNSTAKIYYDQILQDFSKDLIFIENLSFHLDSNMVRYTTYKQKQQQSALSIEESLHYIGNLNWYTSDVQFQTNTINTLQSSGDIKLIPSEIRKKLIELKTLQDRSISAAKFNNGLYGERIGYANRFSGGGDFLAGNYNNSKISKYFSDENRKIEWLLGLQNSQEAKMIGERLTLRLLNEIKLNILELTQLIHKELNKSW